MDKLKSFAAQWPLAVVVGLLIVLQVLAWTLLKNLSFSNVGPELLVVAAGIWQGSISSQKVGRKGWLFILVGIAIAVWIAKSTI